MSLHQRRVIQQQLRHVDNSRDGGANLVRNVGDKLGLESRSFVGGGFGHLKLSSLLVRLTKTFLSLVEVGNVRGDDDDADNVDCAVDTSLGEGREL